MRMHQVSRFKLQVARFSLLLTAFFMVGFLLIAVNLYAAGDLIVEGNVGVGTTSPGRKIGVVGDIGLSGVLRLGSNSYAEGGGALYLEALNGDDFAVMQWDGSAWTPHLYVDSVTGNVGIGTTTPSAKLEVAGNAGTDGIKLPDGTLITTAQDYLLLNVVMTAYTTNTTSLSWVLDVGDSILDWDSIISAGYKEARILTQMWMSAAGNTGYLQMYDKTNTAVVAEFGELTVTDTSSTTIKTSNWVNITSKTGLVNIGFQKKVTGGTCYYRNTSLQFRR